MDLEWGVVHWWHQKGAGPKWPCFAFDMFRFPMTGNMGNPCWERCVSNSVYRINLFIIIYQWLGDVRLIPAVAGLW